MAKKTEKEKTGSMMFRPVGGNVVVRVLNSKEAKEVPEGLVPGDAGDDDDDDELDETTTLGTVVAVGPGEVSLGHRVPMEVSVGDVVMMTVYGGSKFKYKGDVFKLVDQSKIYGVVKDASPTGPFAALAAELK